jgi:Rho guanine nucleotide exchange factor 10
MPRPSVSSSSSSASSSGGSAADNSATEIAERGRLEKQLSDGALLSPVAAPRLRHQLSSPVVLRRRAPRDDGSRRASKTLPRGAFSALGGSQDCDVYGLYGELMNVRDYEEDGSRVGGAIDGTYESLRRSDPELAAIPGKVSTLDRRLRIKSSRPRSLDLSNWSVDSRSSSMYTSSGSEDSVQVPSLLMPNSEKVLTSTPTQQNINSQSISRSDGLPGSKPVVDQPRTIITLMGGRGYVNCRRPAGDKGKTNNQSTPETNSNDAHIVLWEMKL